LIPHEEEKKDIVEGTTRINAKLPHQIDHMLSNSKEDETQATLFAKIQ
jgi:hypothetical protein